jgi:hypothetical protein
MSNQNPNSSPHSSPHSSRSPSISGFPSQQPTSMESSSSSSVSMTSNTDPNALLQQMVLKIQELEAKSAESNNHYQQLYMHNQQLEQQLRSIQPNVSNSSSSVASRVHGKPGNLAKWTGQGNITHWCNAVSNYLTVTATTDGEAQINLICSYLEADILTWWWSKRQELSVGLNAIAKWNWNEMRKVFEKHYHPLQRNTVNRTKLKGLKQIGSFQAYYHKFQEIVSGISDMGAADKLAYFKDGLHYKIQERLLLGSEEVINDFEKLVDAVSYMEAKRFDYYQHRNPSSSGYHGSHGVSSTNSSSSVSSSGSDAMDLSNLFTDGRSYDNLWSDESINLNSAAAAASSKAAAGGNSDKALTVAEINNLIKTKLNQHKVKSKSNSGSSSSGNGGQNVKRLSPEEFKKRITANVCYKCCQTGHVGKGCNNDWNMQNFQ